MRRVWAIAAAAGALLFTSLAFAGVLYMWTDASGRVQYSDQPPKNFTGPVRRIQIDDQPAAPLATPAKAAEPTKAEPASAPAKEGDIGAKRRAARERLQHDVDVAREKLAAARKALAEHPEPDTDERQVVQRPGATAPGGTIPGTVPAASRLNCRTQVKDGKKTTMCPVSMPTEAYFDRIDKLEEDVRHAEEELAAAERAYRRGTD